MISLEECMKDWHKSSETRYALYVRMPAVTLFENVAKPKHLDNSNKQTNKHYGQEDINSVQQLRNSVFSHAVQTLV
jgi:hypothetical protein